MSSKNKIGTPGPFQVIDNHLGAQPGSLYPTEAPRRRFSCENYSTCLNLAAAVNWDNFTCRGCCGEVDQTLYWRAYQIIKKDAVVRGLCQLPDLRTHKIEIGPTEEPRKIAKG